MTTAKPRIYLGLDVGKTDHWACALTEDGQVLWNKTLPNNEARIIDIYTKLATQGQVLVVVDQPATIGALAQHMGDEKDAFIIADAARTLPHTLRSLTTTDKDEASLAMLTGFDLDLSRQVTQVSNRIRGLYTQIHPKLEKVIGSRLDHDAILQVLATWPTAQALKRQVKPELMRNSRNTGHVATPRGRPNSFMLLVSRL